MNNLQLHARQFAAGDANNSVIVVFALALIIIASSGL